MGMFRRLSDPLPLSEASLLALRPSLNAPVLNVEFLPVGPARAAIVVFAEEWGGIGVSIGIRSNEGGQVAVFQNQESIEPEVTIPAALEPALAEAERMGFLFDEDMVANAPAGRGQSQAMLLWGQLMGEIDMSATPAATPIAAPGEPDFEENTRGLPARSTPPGNIPEAAVVPEFVLDEVAQVADPEISLELETEVPTLDLEERLVAPAAQSGAGSSEPDPAEQTEPLVLSDPILEQAGALPAQAQAQPVAPPRPQLSRFRSIDKASGVVRRSDAEDSETRESGSELGRIPLVRVLRGRDGTTRISYLARLLSSF